jgi:hypothetical protein
MAKIFPLHPARPELICWGCDRYCAVGAMACGNGSDRTQHPVELFGDDWNTFGLNAQDEAPDEPSRDRARPSPGE